MESDVYPHKFDVSGIGYLRPSEEEREIVNDIIMNELVYGIFKPESTARLQDVIQNMKQQGCDAVLLGCTELPLVLNDENSALPTLDSTRLLARAALRHAIEEP